MNEMYMIFMDSKATLFVEKETFKTEENKCVKIIESKFENKNEAETLLDEVLTHVIGSVGIPISSINKTNSEKLIRIYRHVLSSVIIKRFTVKNDEVSENESTEKVETNN